VTCPSCSATVPEGARFCPTCGHALHAVADERRVVTVVFGDLVGFTALSETRDPEQVKNLVDRCFALLANDITTYGGRVDKVVGDAVVALFGAPLAHEDDAERAVRAAMQMQRTIEREAPRMGAPVRMRIGVNSGEVLVGALRAGGDYTAMGDVVNAAARLQTAAQPGQVVVGPETHASTASVFHYEPLGQVPVRGRDEPIEAWAALEALVEPGQRQRTRIPLVGRDPEVGLLCHALTAAIGACRPHLALVLGEAGMGKSRLAEEVATAAREEHGALVLEGRSLPYGAANVWWPFAEAVRQACGISPEDSGDEARAKCLRAVSAAGGGSPEDPEHVRTADALLYTLGKEGKLSEVDPARARDEVARGVRRFLSDLAADRPVVLALSDVQWADDSVLAMVDALLDGLVRLPLVVVLTARPDLAERWHPAPGSHNLIVLNVDPLDPVSAGQLVDVLLDGQATDDVRELLVARSGGNPFFLEELAGLLQESGMLVDVPVGSVPVLPATLRGLIAARLDSLPVEQRGVIEDAAVLGRRAGLRALETMAEARGASRARVAVDALAARDLLAVRDERWEFRSDLVREVAYGTLTKAERARRHARFASWLEGASKEKERQDELLEDLARHYAVAAELVAEVGDVVGVPGDVAERALSTLQKAAERAEDREIHPVAARLYDQQLRLLGDEPGPARRHALIGRGRARTALRELEDAHADLEAAVLESRAVGDEVALARALTTRGDLERNEADYAASLATLEEARQLWLRLGDRRGEAAALRRTGLTNLFSGDLDAAEAALVEAFAAFSEIGSRRGVAWANQNLAWISFYRGEQDVAEARLNDSISLFADIGDWGGLGWSLGLMAWVQFTRGHRGEAERLALQARDEAGGHGDRWADGMMTVLLANIRLWQGRAAEAVERALEARRLFEELGDVWGACRALAPLSYALLLTGQPEEARRAVAAAYGAAEHLTDVDAIAYPGILAANVELHAGDGEAAVKALERAQLALEGPGAPAMRVGEEEIAHLVGLALLQTGRPSVGHTWLETALPRVRDVGPRAAALGASALVKAAVGDVEGARARAAEVAALPGGTYMDLVLSLLGAGCAAARVGEGDTAVANLDEAAALLDATDDRVTPAVVALARGRVLEALGDPRSDAALQAARRNLDALGLPAAGWDVAFRHATGAVTGVG
jgi:class 3 adenylate cyclase/tetratricopeptide (TPR) repeat protein